jgi:Neuraminidase (sialidase)
VVRLSNSDSADVMFSRSNDGGLNWSSPKRVNDDTGTENYQWFGTMSAAPNGRIDAIWLDTRCSVARNP